MAKLQTATFPESSVILRIHYSRERGELDVIYEGGSVYRYFDVPEQVFRRFTEAESAGGFLHDEILGRYRHERLR